MVVVEDSLSAGKLSLIGVKSCAVLGTTITQSQALLLAEHVLIGWFDNDDAGTRGYIKLRKAMAPYGVEPKRIQTERDPKLYNAEEINRYIKEAA